MSMIFTIVRTMKPVLPILPALLLLLVAAPARAHDTWLAAKAATVQAGVPVTFEMTSAEHFPTPGSAIAPERIERAACRQGGTAVPLQTGDKAPAVLRLRATPATAAALTCWALLKPRTLDLAPDKVAGYLDEIDAPQAVRQAWQSGPRRWRETYTKNAKALLPGAAPDTQAGTPVGLPLEFVLQTDPAASPARLDVLVLHGGKPLPDLSVALSGGSGTPQRQRSDAAGKASFGMPAGGRWMLSATRLWPTDAAQGQWESQFSTLVFDVPANR